MPRLDRFGKDHVGAVLLIALGAGVLVLGLEYRMGNLTRMGAGFIPVVLGVLLILVGIAIGLTAAAPGQAMINALPGHVDGQSAHAGGPEWRGWACILGGVLAFVVFGKYGGLVPATFASVFVSALGDRNNTIRTATVAGLLLTVFCVIVFHYGLSLQLPLFQWG